MYDYVVEIIEDAGVSVILNRTPPQEVEVFVDQTIVVDVMAEGPQGPAGNPGLVLLEADDPLPDPIIDGVLYLRLTS